MAGMTGPDALSRAILARRPELAGQIHYVNGRAWCDGVNHTTMCEPTGTAEEAAREFAAHPRPGDMRVDPPAVYSTRACPDCGRPQHYTGAEHGWCHDAA